MSSKQHFFKLAKKYLRPQLARVVILAVLLAAIVGVQIGNPLILQHFIDLATSGAALQVLLVTAASFLGFSIFIQVLGLATTYVSTNLAWETTNMLRQDLVRHCLKLDMPFHNNHTPGELIERTDADVTQLGNLFSQFALQIMINLLMMVLVVLVLLREDWRLGLGMGGYMLLCLFIYQRTSTISTAAWQKNRQSQAELQGFIGEQVAGIVDIRTNGAIP